MKRFRLGVALLTAIALLAAQASPGYAQQQQQKKKGKAGTIVKWALIGAGAGAAIGFAAGFHDFDQATFAERKIAETSLAGAGLGGVFGAMFGISRARAGASPNRSDQPSLWTPSPKPRMGARTPDWRSEAWTFVGPPPLRRGPAEGR